MKKITRITTIVMAIAIILTAMNPVTAEAAAKKAGLNKKSVTLTMTTKKTHPSTTLKLKNVRTNKVVKWTTSNKKVASIKKTGKYTCKVTARKAGKAKITCKVNGKKYTCKVVVKDKRNCAPGSNTKNCPCNHTWKEHKATLYYCQCACGECFWAKTADEAGNVWIMHGIENIDNDAAHSGCTTGSKTFVNYKICTKCGEKIEYDVP